MTEACSAEISFISPFTRTAPPTIVISSVDDGTTADSGSVVASDAVAGAVVASDAVAGAVVTSDAGAEGGSGDMTDVKTSCTASSSVDGTANIFIYML